MIRPLVLIATLAGLAACAEAPGTAEQPQRAARATTAMPAMKSFGAPRPAAPARSNIGIARDFLDLSFQMESGRPLPAIIRFDGPVTVTMTGTPPPTASADLDRLLARLRSEAHLQVHRIATGPANITIEFLPRHKMQALVPAAACFVAPRISSWAEFRAARGTGRLDWSTLTRRDKLAVFVPADTSPQEVRDCLHEEVAQALGPINDLYRLTDSVFDDDNFQTVLTGFDMLMLRVYNAPELPNGTTRKEAAARLPAILARLNPAGQNRPAGPAPGPTPRAWLAAIETALGPHASATQRRAAATRAVALARAEGWGDARMAFSLYALGRLALPGEPDTALHAFEAARAIYARLPGTSLQLAHIDMQLAAYALAADQPQAALTLVNRGVPAATRGENAALLATFLMIKADALAQEGRIDAARAARLDSLGWARYGFGTDRTVRARLADIATLAGEPNKG